MIRRKSRFSILLLGMFALALFAPGYAMAAIVSQQECPGAAIPDAIEDDVTPGEVQDTMAFVGTGAVVDETFVLGVNITHTYRGDIQLILEAPSGHSEVIQAYGDWGDEQDLVADYPLTAFLGEPVDGTWTLTVQDWWGGDTGTLNCWTIRQAVYSGNCPGAGIPDAIEDDVTPGQVMGVTTFVGTGLLVDAFFVLDVNISHTYRGDLQLVLAAPSGYTAVVQAYDEWGGEADLVAEYPLDDFIGEPLDGTWTLIVQDWWTDDTGSLNCWYIKQVFRNCPDVAIPDAIDDDITPGEVTDSIAIAGTGLLVDSTFVLDVDITHTYYPDLEILLTSPEGTTLTIRPYGDGDGEDMLQGFSLTGFEGEALDGEWTITVQDWWTAGTGTLNCWTIRYLEDFTDPDCPVVPIPLAIADNVTPSETTSEITFAATGKTVDIAFTVEVNIGHPWVGDLAVRLTSPLGTTVTLLDKDTGEGSELAETYTTNGPLVDFLGEDLDGTWVLTVENWYEWETGELRCWKITQPEFSWTEDCPALDIPDCIDDEVTPSQVTSDIVLATPNTVSGEFAVGVDISHTYRGDLKLLLTSPSGTTLLLKTYNDDGNEDVLGVYPYSLIPAGSFSAFVGEPLAGTWTLTIEDWWTGDTGTLNCWAISDPGTPPAGDGADWDFEDGTTGDWFIYRNSNLTVMRNVLDPDEGDQVIELRANTMDTWFCLGAPGGGDLGETHTVLQWKMKSLGLFYFYVKVTTPAGERWLYYTPSDVDKLLQNLYVHHGAGYAATYGQWSTYVRDLAADLDEAEPGNTITTVDCLFVRGVNVRIDDIAFLAAIPAGWDSDGDGLTDAEENDVYGTSPYNADTDNDGMNDGPEAAMWGVDWNGDADDDGTVNLLDEDSDDDGFLDGMENAAGSDPADPLSVPAVARNFEDGSTAGWYIASGQGIIRNVADAENGTLVTELRGSRTSTMYGLVREDGTPWQDNVNTSITWKMKYSEMYYIYVDAVTTFGHRYMYYTPHDADYLSLGDYVHHGLGISSRDGTWRTFTRDLAADLDEAEPGNIILEVNRFLIRGSGRIDDVALVGGGG